MMRIKEVTPDYVTLEVSETLVRQDYDLVLPELERLVAVNCGHLNILLDLHDFEGWEPEALGVEQHFALKQRHDRGKVAIVAEPVDEARGNRVAAPMFSGDLRFFDRASTPDARHWLSQHGGTP